MLWAGSDHWDLFVGRDSLGYAQLGAMPTWHPHQNLHASLADVLRTIQMQRSGWRRPRVRLWLSGALARPFVLVRPVGIKSDAELKLLAQAQAGRITDLLGPAALWLSNPGKSGLTLVAAMDLAVRDALVEAASKAGVRLQSMRPLWASLLIEVVSTTRSVQLLAAEDPDALTVIVSQDEQWVTADSYVPRPEQAPRQALVARRMIAANVPVEAAVFVSGAVGAAAAAANTWLAAQWTAAEPR